MILMCSLRQQLMGFQQAAAHKLPGDLLDVSSILQTDFLVFKCAIL